MRWKLRYPGEAYEPVMSEAEDGLAIAQLVLDGIRRRLGEAVEFPHE